MRDRTKFAYLLTLFAVSCHPTDDQKTIRILPPPVVSYAQPKDDEPLICQHNMVHVVGDYCKLVEHKCIEWLDPPSVRSEVRRCLTYSAGTCTSSRTHMDFCIDVNEHVEEDGNMPMTNLNWHEALAICSSE